MWTKSLAVISVPSSHYVCAVQLCMSV